MENGFVSKECTKQIDMLPAPVFNSNHNESIEKRQMRDDNFRDNSRSPLGSRTRFLGRNHFKRQWQYDMLNLMKQELNQRLDTLFEKMSEGHRGSQ